jgi:hypothetical protein
MRRAEVVVKRDGMTVHDRYGGVRSHPLLATIRDARQGMTQALRLLNFDAIPARNPGRPSGDGEGDE